MPYPLPLTRTEAYLAYKAGVIQQSDLKPSLAVPRNGIDAWLAYWTGLAEDYPKREDGTPHILQEEEAYIAYLCGVLDEYPEKCLRRVGAYLRYLISARWGRPDHPLNREELYLSLIKTQFIPSGDPSSDIEIDGTAKAPFVDVKMYGDTFQQSYTGKNLLQLVESSITISGVTLTLNSDGTFGLAGTATADTEFSRTVSLAGSGIVGGQSYTISSDAPIETYGISYYVHSTNSAGQWNKTLLGFRSVGTQTAQTPSTDYIKFVVRVGNGTTVNYPSIKTMIEAGSTASAYEPYVGGQASPNPEYPQAIQTVTGRQVVKVEGKNLCSSEWESGAYSTATGEKSEGSGYRTAGFVEVRPNTTYIVSRASSGVAMNVLEYNSSKVFTYYKGDSVRAGGSFTTQSDTRYITMYRGTSGGIADMMLEKGSTISAYEPYSSNDYEINLGKNLFNKGNYTDADGYYIGSSGRYTAASNNHTAIIPIEPNTTYTVSKPAQATYNRFRVGISDTLASAGDYFPIWGGSDSATEVTLTSGSKSRYMYIYYAVTKNVSDAIASLMLEKGSTATTYAPYFEPIELCKLGTYQDYIYKSDGKWYLRKEVGKTKLSSSWNWYYNSNSHGFSVVFVAGRNWGVYAGYCSHATVQESSSTWTGVGKCGWNASNTFWFEDGGMVATSAADFKTWLDSNEVNVYYALATPTDTEITNTALIDQLNALKNGGSYTGTTYIKVSATDPNLPGLLYVEAPKYD